ncbi:hypothetical protein MIMGU_mgv1a020275mg, partial [Erythranthe guttata]
ERKRTRDCDIYEDEEAKRSVMQRAAELLARLAKEYNLPSFVKCMLPSNVSQGFWLHLPKKFCTVNLPNEDTPVVLVDELGREHTTSYLLGRNGLSAGWRAFSMKHKLLKGDLLIFLLTEPCKFKVHIVRVNDIEVLFAALCLMDLRFSCEGNDSGCHSANSIDQFKDISGFEDFKIQLGGLILDSEMPKNIIAKYYNLCCSQRMFLHDHLINGLSTKLAVVMISETTNISEAVRSADVSTSLHHLECWEKTLKAFEDLGMAVGFIRNRLHKLLEILREAQSNNESKMTMRAQADHVSGNLETTLNVEALIGSLEAEIETLRWKNEKFEFEFRELARAPW